MGCPRSGPGPRGCWLNARVIASYFQVAESQVILCSCRCLSKAGIRATSRLRCPMSWLVSPSSQVVRRLFPGCGIENHGVPGHRCSPRMSVRFSGFEIGLLPGGGIPGHWCSPGVFARVSGPGTRVTSRWRNPRSSVRSIHLDRRSSSRGDGLLPGCAVPRHLRSPFIGSLLPGGGLERDSVPGHGGNAFLSGRRRRASRFRGNPRSCQFSRCVGESGLQVVI